MGSIEQGIARQAIRSGQPLPDRIENAPTLTDGNYVFLEAFYELDSERPASDMQVRGIPRSKIIEYAERYDFDFEQTEDLIYIVRAIDREHLKRARENAKS